MKQLSKQTKIEAFKYCIEEMKNRDAEGLCMIISEYLYDIDIKVHPIPSCIRVYIEEFKIPEERYGIFHNYSWEVDPFDFNSRIKFCEEKIKEIQNQK